MARLKWMCAHVVWKEEKQNKKKKQMHEIFYVLKHVHEQSSRKAFRGWKQKSGKDKQ